MRTPPLPNLRAPTGLGLPVGKGWPFSAARLFLPFMRGFPSLSTLTLWGKVG